MQTCCPVLELRQYTLYPGQRDVMIELFDRELVEPQEAVGMRVVGQFRDLDRPDRFVWLRGFPDMESRRQSLVAFYGGPVWKANRDAANATMIDSDNVLLLRPIDPQSGFALGKATRPLPGASERSSLIVATIYYLDGPPADATIRAFEGHLRRPIASLRTEPAENTFPALPVRAGEQVLISFSPFAAGAPPPELLARLVREPEQLRLEPTARSLLR
jgi:hypothetical protein